MKYESPFGKISTCSFISSCRGHPPLHFTKRKKKKMTRPTRLPWSQRLCFGVGHSLNDLAASMWFSYLIVYLQLVLGFDPNYAGFVLLVGQVADAIATPLLGYEISNVDGGKWCRGYGKRKMLHLIGTVLVIASFPFIFSVCPGCENASQFAYTVMLVPLVIVFQIGWAAVQVSHLSLIPAITPHETERDFLNVLRYAVDIISDISTYIIVWCVFDLTRKPTGSHHTITGDYANKFMLIVIIIVGVGSFFSVIFHIGVRENQYSEQDSEEYTRVGTDGVAQSPKREDKEDSQKTVSWKGWLREVHFYQVGLLYTFVRMFQNMSLVFTPLYLQESLKANDDFIAKIPLVMNVSGFVISCALPKFFKVFSKKVTFLAGAVIGVGSCMWVAVGRGPGFCAKGIYGVGVLMGGASSILVVSCLSFIHDLIGTSAESGAFVYGCMSFCDKLANGIAGMVVQHMHALNCQGCDWFYRDVLSYGVGSTAIIASLILLFLLPANLGQRRSIYNGAALLPKDSANAITINYKSTAENPEEIKPLLDKEAESSLK